MLKQGKKFGLIILILSFGLVSCGPPEYVPIDDEISNKDKPIQSVTNAPTEILSILSGATQIQHDDMENEEITLWGFADPALNREGGIATLSQDGEDSAFLGLDASINSGTSLLLLIKPNPETEIKFGMEQGEWETDTYQSWGIISFDGKNFQTDIYQNGIYDQDYEFANGYLLEAGNWYYILFSVGQDYGTVYIWDKNNPDDFSFHIMDNFESWHEINWDFLIQVFKGEVQIDDVSIYQTPQDIKIGQEQASESPPAENEEANEVLAVQADIIFHNGNILTIQPGLPIEEALAVKGDAILAVGDQDNVFAYEGESTLMVDLEGRTLMPGFVDPHTHLLNDAESNMGMNISEAQEYGLENGITTLANMYTEEWFLQELIDLDDSGELRIRTNVYLTGTDNCGASQGDWYTAYPPGSEFGEKLHVAGVKLFTDGGTCGYPAVTEETHEGAGQGDLLMSDSELSGLVRMADDAGYQVAIHALGDRAVDQALAALQAVANNSNNPERHRIEHAFYLRDDQYDDFGLAGIHPVIFGYWPTCSATGEGRTERWKEIINHTRNLVRANPDLVMAVKTDTPWGGPPIPLMELYSLTTLKEVDEDGSVCEPAEWLADQTISMDEALPMVTINAAYLLFMEDEIGSLEAGKLADMIILSDNPQAIPVDEIKDLQVLMTMVGGQVKFCADGFEHLCP